MSEEINRFQFTSLEIPRGFQDDGRISPFDSSALVERLVAEQQYLDTQKHLGTIDIALSAQVGMAASLLLEKLQTEYQTDPSLYSGGKTSGSLLLEAAKAPWDWKAICVTAGAYALTSAAGRINKHATFRKEARQNLEMIVGAEEYIPSTKRETFMRRAKQKLGRGVVTAAGCVVAYKVGESGTVTQDVIAGGTLFAAALGSIGVTNLRMKAHERKYTPLSARQIR